ncbi:MAG: Z1 domain-containing protein [Solirubrobacterales bacterium]|nr:Z1 domain-containing protein [Solirubrobacterales bacterium]
MTDPPSNIQAIVGNLELQTRSGLKLAAARDAVIQMGMSEQPVDQAVALIKKKMDEVRDREIPRTMSAEGRESWYLGPNFETDVYWPALHGILKADGWDEDSLQAVDDSSTKVLSMLEHPGTGKFSTKGMVLGYVQSGKTTNFTSVIAKAADSGYRFFIVMSGIHNGLRMQTQDRLDEQLVFANPEDWIALTTSETDFTPNTNVNAFLHGDKKVLCVVKKNTTRLRNMCEWLSGANEAVLRACPVLIIDDEADQASVNTAREENDPSVINQRIRDILDVLPKAAYVGYTATPFANILIDPSDEADLYPRDFIVDLPRPENYVGPETIFGREPLRHDDDATIESEGLDMVRFVDDDEIPNLRPKGNNLDDFSPQITPSLRKAIRYFLLSTAARRARGAGNKHATMLVHTTMRVLVHAEFRRLITKELGVLASSLAQNDEALLDGLRDQWDEESSRVTVDGFATVTFEQLLSHLPEVLTRARVIMDNSQSEDRLAYGDEPTVAIAVGGNTLSRGLTLEGLSVSFFVRTSNAYDTLLQMGRWFGYRKGYYDMPRIWMTREMVEWFRHLATVEREIRYDIERYEAEHLTPMDFGPRVATHPQLAITAASKMRAAVPALVSYSGRRLQTIRFRREDRAWLDFNFKAGRALVGAALNDGGSADHVEGLKGVTVIRNVDADLICDFFSSYKFSEGSLELNADSINGYIREQNKVGELARFTVAVMGRGTKTDEAPIDFAPGVSAPPIVRSRLRNVSGEEADIKALMSKQDRAVDLNLPSADVAQMKNSELTQLRNSPAHNGKGDGAGLLLLYPISKISTPKERSEAIREPLDAVADVLGVGIVFPEAQTTEGSQTYMTADLSSHVVEEPTAEDELLEDGLEKDLA